MQFIVAALTLTSFLLAAPAQAYPVTADTLNCRSSPSTSASIVRTYTKGTNIDIQCQTTGTKVETTNIWDKTQHGCYVSDYYVKTGFSGFIPGVPKCGGTSTGSPCTTVNDKTIALIKEFEGFVPRPAPDPIGLPTVGYGHLCQTKTCSEAGPFPLTTTTATALLKKDLGRFTKCIADMINDSVTLNDNQFGALVSWAFNVGCGNAQSSTLIKRLNNKESPNAVAEQELPKWNKAGNPPKVLPGLTRRRAAEVVLFKTASSKQAHPKCT